jgi:hypothetical protein
MATLGQDNFGEIIKLVNTLVLNEQGEPVLKEGESLPTDVMMVVINAVVERLGK